MFKAVWLLGQPEISDLFHTAAHCSSFARLSAMEPQDPSRGSFVVINVMQKQIIQKRGKGWDSADNETQKQEIKQSETNLFPTGPLNNTVVPGGPSGKEPTCQCRRRKRCSFHPWVRKVPRRRAWQPTPVLLPGESPMDR